MGYDLFAALLPEGTPSVVRIVCMAVTAFLVSGLLVRLFFASRLTRRLVA